MKKKKKVKSKSKKKAPKKSCSKSISCEKAYGDPMPVRQVSEHYNLETGEIYPKIFLTESWWVKLKRFLGLIP
jgi:hypothetical protein